MLGVRRRRRAVAISVAALIVLFVAWLVACYLVIASPSVDRPTRADAVVVLGPPEANGRLAVAQKLLDEHIATNLVISINSPKQRQASRLCMHPPAGVAVSCFTPDPATTRGEAEQVRRLVRQHGWTALVVVTSTYHISRARLIFKRCFDGRLQMVAARRHISISDWAYQFVYQTGAYIKAAFQSGC